MWLTSALVLTCGGCPWDVPECVVFAGPARLKVQQRFFASAAECAALRSNVGLRAQFYLDGFDEPCELEPVRAEDGSLSVDHDCEYPSVDVTPGNLTFSLRWYVVSPNAKKQLVIAESYGAAHFCKYHRDDGSLPPAEWTLNFDDPGINAEPVEQWTKAARVGLSSERLRFNCDERGPLLSGGSPCDAPEETPAGPVLDTCSNYEELCRGTLFSVETDATCSTDAAR